MPSIAELKSRVNEVINSHSKEIIGIAKTVLQTPETGFRKFNTSRLISRKFTESAISHRDDLAITGIKGMLNGSSDGPTVVVLGELDSLIAPG